MNWNYHRWNQEEVPDILVQRGSRSDGLVMAFTGFRGQLSVGAYDFFDFANKSGHHRILLKDPLFCCYLGGIPGYADDVPGLAACLREQIDALAPQRTMFIGTSGGSFPALLFGHLLQADYVHAFSPFTILDPDAIDRMPHAFPFAAPFAGRVRQLGPAVAPYLDLHPLLSDWNGRTTFNLHASNGDPLTVENCLRLKDLPGVRLFSYPCREHNVLRRIMRDGMLDTLLDFANQEDLPAILARL